MVPNIHAEDFEELEDELKDELEDKLLEDKLAALKKKLEDPYA